MRHWASLSYALNSDQGFKSKLQAKEDTSIKGTVCSLGPKYARHSNVVTFDKNS